MSRTDTVGEEIYNDGEESLADEQGRGTDDDETPDVVDMTSAYFNYHSFMDKTSRTKWSKHDTERFYEVITPLFSSIMFVILFDWFGLGHLTYDTKELHCLLCRKCYETLGIRSKISC